MRLEDYLYEDYKEYEKACDKMREHNKGYLEIFSKDLEQNGLTAKTINGHLSNVDFFLNIFLLREGIFTMDENG